jgi:hypothetical protein
VFSIQRVVVRALNTDPSIEQSIQLAVQNQKKLEAKKIEVEIASKEADIEVAKAQGIARANQIINASLTAEYLQHEINMALAEFAKHEGQTVVIPANMQGFQLMLNRDALRRGVATPTKPPWAPSAWCLGPSAAGAFRYAGRAPARSRRPRHRGLRPARAA